MLSNVTKPLQCLPEYECFENIRFKTNYLPKIIYKTPLTHRINRKKFHRFHDRRNYAIVGTHIYVLELYSRKSSHLNFNGTNISQLSDSMNKKYNTYDKISQY